MKKRILLATIASILMIFAFVSCSNEIAPEDKLGTITFGEDDSRAVTTVVKYSKEAEEMVWFYRATKLDDGYTTGSTGEKFVSVAEFAKTGSDPETIATSMTGLSGKTLNNKFSYGLWKIELKGYNCDDVEIKTENSKEKAIPKTSASEEYESTIESVLVSKDSNSTKAKIELGDNPTTAIEFGEITFSDSKITSEKSFSLTVTDKSEKGTITVPGNYSKTESESTRTVTNPVIPANGGSVTFGGLTYTPTEGKEISGEHELEFVLKQTLSGTNNTTINAALYTLKMDVQKGTTTTVSGSLIKNDETGSITINSVQDVTPITLRKVIDVTSVDTTAGTAKVSKKDGVTVNIGNAAFKLPEGTKIAVTSDSVAIDDNTAATKTGTADGTFGIESKEKTESGITIETGETALPFDLTLPVSEDNTKLVEVTNFFGKGLSITKVWHENKKLAKYANLPETSDDENAETRTSTESYDYNAETGYMTLRVFHASEFNIITRPVVAKVTIGSTTTPYYTLKDAVAAVNGDESGSDRTITLATDETLSERLTLSKGVTIDLNRKSLTLSVETSADNKNEGAFELPDANNTYSVTVKNGTIKGTVTGKQPNVFALHKNANLALEDVTMDVSAFRGVQVYPNTNSASLTVKDSSIKIVGAYAVATEATLDDEGKTSDNITMAIENSTLETLSGDDDCTGLLINVPGTYTIKSSKISGARQGAILRGGDITITGSAFSSTGKKTTGYDWPTEESPNDWLDGNKMPLAAIVIGNRNSSYAYKTSVTFNGTNTLEIGESTVRRQIYVYQADKATDSETADRSVTVDGYNENWTVNSNINGATLKNTEAKTIYVADATSFISACANCESGWTVKLLDDITLGGGIDLE